MRFLSEALYSEIKSTLNIAIPISIAQLGFMLMGVADTIQVGHMNNLAKESVAAAGISNGLFFTIGVIGFIALQVIGPMIANAFADKDFVECNKIWKTNILNAVFLGIVSMILIELFNQNIGIFNQKSEVATLIPTYTRIINLSILPMFVFTAIKQLSDGLEKAKFAMVVTLIALVLNVILNHIFINGFGAIPAMGLNGAGIATLISRTFMAIAMYFVIFKSKIFKEITTINSFKIDFAKIKYQLKVGITSGFQGFFEVAIFMAAATFMGHLGAIELAAHQIAINPASCTYMMVTGIAAAGGIRVGGFLGDNEKVKTAGTASLLIGFGFMAVCCFLMIIGNDFLAKLYIKDPQVLALASQLIIIAGIFQLSDGIQAVCLGNLRGLADVNYPTIVTFISYWLVGLPVCYVLAFIMNMGPVGIWIGLCVGLTVSALALTYRFYSLVK